MGRMVKCSYEVCSTCKYRTKMNSGSTQSSFNFACYYSVIEGHSRCFDGYEKVLPAGMCDKYVEGESATTEKGWTADDMTLRYQRKVKAGLNL